MINKYFIILILSFLIPACTSLPPIATSPHPSKEWEAKGSFSARREGDAWSGSFDWIQQSKNNYQIHFYGPFGVGNTYLLGNPSRVIWKDNDGETVASTPNELVYRKTGFLFPVSYLYDWILGHPAPGDVQNKQLDNQGNIVYFEQAGWKVEYLSYQKVGLQTLPTLMRLTHEGIQLKLVIRQWEFR